MSQNNPLTALLDARPFILLDGAMATELEARGCNLADSLWSAKVLVDNPELIREVPLDYFRAGAQVVITASPGEADIVTCLDGESLRSREVRLVLAEKRVNFFGPKGCSPNATAGFDRKPRKRRYSTAFLLL